MPIYEYVCRDCRQRSSLLVLSVRNLPPAYCGSCGSSHVDRVMSRFAAPKSEEARLESLADPASLGGLDENDPQSMARFMRKMGDEIGEDVGDNIEDMMDAAPGKDGEATADTDI